MLLIQKKYNYFSLKDVPGNAGVRDQVMALQWVQENIINFGGDPDLVTVNGQSAGSFASTYHIMSPLTRLHFSDKDFETGFMEIERIIKNCVL